MVRLIIINLYISLSNSSLNLRQAYMQAPFPPKSESTRCIHGKELYIIIMSISMAAHNATVRWHFNWQLRLYDTAADVQLETERQILARWRMPHAAVAGLVIINHNRVYIQLGIFRDANLILWRAISPADEHAENAVRKRRLSRDCWSVHGNQLTWRIRTWLLYKSDY
jgi:hypothetical protein